MSTKLISYFFTTLFFITVSFYSYTMNTPGTLDPSFGGGALGPLPGTVITDFDGGFDFSNALKRQSDRKLIVAGRAFSSGSTQFGLARYNTDGTLDETFGGGTLGPKPGTVLTNFGGISEVNALVVQPDNKIVAAGRNTPNFALARYNTDGSLDETFGGGALGPLPGTVVTNLGGNDIIHALVLQSDDKLVAAGESDANFALARYKTDGTLDETFGGGMLGPLPGTVVTDFGNSDRANGLVLQPDGKLVAAGTTNGNFALARYNLDGSLDETFGGGTLGPLPGTVVTDLGGTDIINALVLQPDGKLVAAGISNTAGTNDFVLARYNANGSLDVTFGGTFGSLPGTVLTDLGGNDTANALIIQPNGNSLKLVASGFRISGSSDFALAQYFAVNNVSPLVSAVIAKYCLN